MTGIYLSGTGNTKHCVEKFLSLISPSADIIPIESENAKEAVKTNDTIVLGYPIQFSNAPIMVRDFIKDCGRLFCGKKVFIIVTEGLFSGDGTGCTARLLKKSGAEVLGGMQIKMPDSVCDSKALKKSLEANKKIIMEADRKIEKTAKNINNGRYPKEGLSFFAHLLGLIGQRLWFFNKTNSYSNELKISDACIGCGKCASLCPMKNIVMKDNKPIAKGKCTMCYRCISHCPQKAITLIGKEVYEQVLFKKYL